jgi:hypothetical protein
VKMLITNGGPHPADKWADLTTETILEMIAVADDADTAEAQNARAAKRSLRPILFDIFNGHHEDVQQGERVDLKAIKDHGEACAHCEKKYELHDGVAITLQNVNAALSATPFAAHFAQAHVQAVLQQIIGQHTVNVQHIERSWHRDRLAKGA